VADRSVLETWVQSLAAELGLEIEVDIRLLLDLARVAAHEVDRPAAPLTTFLVGYAAGVRGGGADEVAAAAARAAKAAAEWPSRA